MDQKRNLIRLQQTLEDNQDKIRNIKDIESGNKFVESLFDELNKELNEKVIINLKNLIKSLLFEKKLILRI